MKVPFTILQTAIATIAIFLFVTCLVGDVFLFNIDVSGMNKNKFLFNGIVSLIMLLVSIIFILKPSISGFVSKDNVEENPIPALTAIRTYICFLALDASIVLSIMIFGVLVMENAIKYIVIIAPIIFIIGAVKYVFDIRRIGIDSVDYKDEIE